MKERVKVGGEAKTGPQRSSRHQGGNDMRIVLANPDRLIADALACILSRGEGIDIVGKFYSCDHLVENIDQARADVVVISAAFEEVQEVCTDLKGSAPGVAILVIGGPSEWEWAVEAGAAGYVGTEASSEQLLDSVVKIGEGGFVVTGTNRRVVTTDAVTGRKPSLSNLTAREKEVLSLLSRGFSNREIAGQLYLSEHTVRTHVQNLRAKLNVRSKFQAALLAMQSGMPAHSTSFKF